MILRVHVNGEKFIQTRFADQAVLDKIEELLSNANAVIRIPDDDDEFNDEYGDDPIPDERRKYVLIPVRSITHVEKL
jgi:hypothetical protein